MKKSISAIAIGIALCLGSIIIAVISGAFDDPEPTAAPTAISQPTTTTTPTAKKTPQPNRILGDDLVHIGEDVPAGTYRVIETISDGCYWKKSNDAEGSDIIANDLPPGGRPQVVLKAGQWFTSKRCPDWLKK